MISVTPLCSGMLEALSKANGTSKSAVVEQLIRREYNHSDVLPCKPEKQAK